MTYRVSCTMIYNGYIEVEADSEEEALKKGKKRCAIDEKAAPKTLCGKDFELVEAKVDFVEKP